MKKQLEISIKDIWLFTNAILLFASTISWIIGNENVFGVCSSIILLLSYPSNLLIGWLFFAYGNFNELPGVMLLLTFVCSGIGYLQWFFFVPRIVKFFRKKVSRNSDTKISESVNNGKQIQGSNLVNTIPEWQMNWFDEHKHSPVERIFEQDKK